MHRLEHISGKRCALWFGCELCEAEENKQTQSLEDYLIKSIHLGDVALVSQLIRLLKSPSQREKYREIWQRVVRERKQN